MALTATSVVLMPLLGRAKHRLAERLGSTATAGEGTQNVLCGIQAAAVLVGLAANAAFGAWWLDPLDRPVHRLRRGQGRPRGLARRELRRCCAP